MTPSSADTDEIADLQSRAALLLARNALGGAANIVGHQNGTECYRQAVVHRIAKGVYDLYDRSEEIALAVEHFIRKILPPPMGASDGAQSLRSRSYAQTGKLPHRQDLRSREEEE